MKKVSIIIPVYKAEIYIEECLTSIINQTYNNLEIICIDDASPDNSHFILNHFAEKDSRIQIITLTKNVGAYNARNIGTEKSTGEYLCNIDADDYVSVDAIELAIKEFENNKLTDCVLLKLKLVSNNIITDFKMDDFSCLSGKEAFIKSINWKIHGIHVMKTSLLKNIKTAICTNVHRDEVLTRQIYFSSKEVRLCKGIYYYRQQQESIIHRIHRSRFDYLFEPELIYQHIDNIEKYPEAIYEINIAKYYRLINIYHFYYHNSKKLNEKDKQYGIDMIKKSWDNINRKNLSFLQKQRIKPFFISSFRLFCAIENLYFSLKEYCTKNSPFFESVK